MSETRRLTVAQATVSFLAAQYSERDGVEQKLFAGCFGIFGHGNVAGLGPGAAAGRDRQPGALPYILGRNEQAMVHTASAYARMKDRLQTYAVSTSVGPGATNMVTGAALATINRLPVLLLPADTFADRAASPLLQELELRTPETSPSTTASGRCRSISTGSGGPNNCPRRCCRRCGC